MARPWPGRGCGHEGNGAGLLPGAVAEGPLGILLRPRGAPGEKEGPGEGAVREGRGPGIQRWDQSEQRRRRRRWGSPRLWARLGRGRPRVREVLRGQSLPTLGDPASLTPPPPRVLPPLATPASRSLPAPAGTALPSPFRAQPPLPRSLPAGGGGSSRSWRCGELGGSWQGLTAFLLGVVSGVPPSSTLIQSPFRPPPSTPQLLQPPPQPDRLQGWVDGRILNPPEEFPCQSPLRLHYASRGSYPTSNPPVLFKDSRGFSWWLRWQRICLQCRRPG